MCKIVRAGISSLFIWLICGYSVNGQVIIERREASFRLAEIPEQYRDSILNAYWPPDIEYPKKARTEAVKTVVWVRVTVGEQGRPVEAVAQPSGHPNLGFEEAAEKAARSGLYRPRWNGPYPVTYAGFYPIAFRDPGQQPRNYTVRATPHGIGYDAPVMIPDAPIQVTFPAKAASKLIEAEVWLRLLINKRGAVAHAEIEKSSVEGFGFGEMALKNAKKALFPVKMMEGRPSEYRAYTVVNFRFTDDQLLALRLPLPGQSATIDAPPKLKAIPFVNYPDEARRAGIEGEVIVAALVDTNGQVVTARIDSSSGEPLLDASALSNARERVYQPAVHQSRKVMAWVKYPVDFPQNSKRAAQRYVDSLNRKLRAEQKTIHTGEADSGRPDRTDAVITNPSNSDDVVDPDVLPQFTKYNRARFPESEFAQGVRATVKLAALIDDKGEAVRIDITRSSGYDALDNSAGTAATGHRFKPGTVDGKPVKSWMTWLVKFEPDSKDVITADQEKAEAKGLILPETERIVTPQMPESALKKGHFGTVWLEIEVDGSGKVSSAEVARSSGFAELDSAAMSVAKKDSFKPATYKGKPVSFKMKYRVIFGQEKKGER